MTMLYKHIGITRQAVAQYDLRQAAFDSRTKKLLAEVEELRMEHPGCGVEKMYYTLQPTFLGRDRFVDLFMDMGFRLRKRRNYRRTTYSVASKYTNLIKGMQVTSPSIVWQSDIRYYEVAGRFFYVVFIIDVYTKIIVGHQVSENMRATANMKAMIMALKDNQAPAIHHSDRGGQYIYGDYIKLLKDNKCKISMCKSSQDNAYAERINRTIKEEYLDYWKPANFKELKTLTSRAVTQYNTRRNHNSLGRMSPFAFKDLWGKQKKKERRTEIIFNNETV